MTESIKTKAALFDALPPEWPEDPMPGIRQALGSGCRKIVVLDDDPTGTQTVHGIPVLTTWTLEVLAEELGRQGPGFFILTNSRSLDRDTACDLGRQIGANLRTASRKTGTDLLIISRSDSTLRGHFPHEVNAVSETYKDAGRPILLFPFFPEGGRFTLNDIHYVAEGNDLVPAGLTPYAKDPAFGFRASNLKAWVEEKTGKQIPAQEVVSLCLDLIRKGGPKAVFHILTGIPDGAACIVNAVSYRDVEVVAAALFRAMDKGRHFRFRTAAAFVRVMMGINPRPGFLEKKDLAADTSFGGLFLVGSYVPKTTAQVAALTRTTDISSIEIRVDRLLSGHTRNEEIRTAADHVNEGLGQGKDVVLFTSRNLVRGQDAKSSLDIGNLVSDSLIQIVRSLTARPRYLVAKGGITSSDVATRGLGVKRAMVLGQVQPGVPVWKLEQEAVWPGMAYIVFPGNVGTDEALVQIRQRLA